MVTTEKMRIPHPREGNKDSYKYLIELNNFCLQLCQETEYLDLQQANGMSSQQKVQFSLQAVLQQLLGLPKNPKFPFQAAVWKNPRINTPCISRMLYRNDIISKRPYETTNSLTLTIDIDQLRQKQYAVHYRRGQGVLV